MLFPQVKNLQRLIGKGALFLVKFYFDLKMDFDLTTLNQGTLLIEFMTQNNENIHVKFVGVRNVELRTGPYDCVRLVGVVVEDTTQNQWPGVKVRVSTEDEDTLLAFYCSSIELQDE